MTPYRPVGNCREIFTCREGEVRLCGPSGTGKTRAGLELLLRRMLVFPGARGLLARGTRSSLTHSSMQIFESEVCPRSLINGWRLREGRSSYLFPNGSELVLGGLDCVERVMSAQYDIVMVDEATEITEHDWEALSTRLRSNVIPWQQAVAMCNPSAPTHWLARRVGMYCIDTTHADNPTVTKEYLERLGRLSGHRRQRLFLGKWVAAEGMVYPDYERALREPEGMGEDERLPVGGIDFGFNDPQAQLFGWLWWKEGTPHLHVEEEYKTERKSLATHAEWLRGFPSETKWWADPSRPDSIKELQRGRILVRPAVNNVLYGISRVCRMFESDQLTISPSCRELLDEIAGYCYKPDSLGENPVKGNDHLLDCLRYLCCGIAGATRGTAAKIITRRGRR